MKKTLYIFTTKYPYGNSDTPYLTRELEYLENYFANITLVPFYSDEKELLITNKYRIDRSLSISRQNLNHKAFLAHKSYMYEAYAAIFHRRIDRLRKLLWTVKTAWTIADWAIKNIENNPNDLLYSYWFSAIPIGLAFARDKGLKLRIAARAHGGDLYHERTYSQYFPLRSYTLDRIDRLFIISQNGYDYLSKNYPKYRKKFEISRLGVAGSGSLSSPSNEPRSVAFVSCSYLRPVKRINLLCKIISTIGDLYPDWRITWNHFGGGDPADTEKINKTVGLFPRNITSKLWGSVSNEKISEFYKKNVVDLFISVSSSEGIPVSMMEALSFGIPIISTNVGGVSELVSQENGLLLDNEIIVEEAAKSIMNFVLNGHHITKRTAAQKSWSEKYDSNKNYADFAYRLANI